MFTLVRHSVVKSPAGRGGAADIKTLLILAKGNNLPGKR